MLEDNNNDSILQALSDLNQNTVATNNSIKELQEYFLIKDKREQEKQAKAEEEESKALEVKEQEEQTSKDAEQQQVDTYTELLTDIRDNVQLSNEIFAGQLFFTGVIAGLLVGIILWNRIFKL